MKLMIAAATALTMAALPAWAQSTTVEFASSDGTTALVTFYEDGTASMDGADPIPYTMDEANKTICGQAPEGDICTTFEEFGEEVGFSTGYTSTNGQAGTATITAKD